MKRYGRTVVTLPSARQHGYAAHLTGADAADYAGSCQEPVQVALTGVASLALHRVKAWRTEDVDYASGHGHIGGFSEPPLRHVDINVRCRKCPECLKARAFHWTERAFVECGRASRTWFCTLTLTPEHQSRCIMFARAECARRVVEYVDGSDMAFKAQVRPVVAEVQRFLKRIRKAAPGLRYLAAIEKHTSGLPHVHMLIHETGQPITHRRLTAAWNWGFSNFKLVPYGEQRKAARYVCKYLTKSLVTRICNSKNYGK